MFKSRFRAAFLIAVLLLAGLGYLFAHSALAFDATTFEPTLGRRDLWRVVNYLCVPSAKIGAPFPCAEVNPGDQGASGWAKLRVGKAHILTIPTDHVSGIESRALQTPASAAYWQAAWDARSLLEADVGRRLPRDEVALAINSAYARTQDQFHIHTACVRPSVRAELASEHARIGSQWVRLRNPLRGSTYMVRRLDTDHLGDQNIIDLLPKSLKSNGTTMARQALVVVGATFDGGSEGFYLLNTQATDTQLGDGESLLDLQCR